MKRCPACTRDPDPRGWSACFDCRELMAEQRAVSALHPQNHELLLGIRRLVRYDLEQRDTARGGDGLPAEERRTHVLSLALLDRLIHAVSALPAPDLSDAHVDRMVRHLFRAFDDVNIGHEPLHDFDVVDEGERGDHWRELARAAIRLGAVLPEAST